MKTRTSNFKTYELVYRDKNKNELRTKRTECQNIKQAREEARYLFATTSMNDLHKIIARRVY